MRSVASIFDWPELSSEEVGFSNLIRSASGRTHIAIAGFRYRVHFPIEFQFPFSPVVEMGFDFGGRRITLESDRVPRMEALKDLLSGMDDRLLPPEVLGAVMESALEGVLKAAEKTFGCPIAIERVVPYQDGSEELGSSLLNVQLQPEPGSATEPIRIRIRLDEPALELFSGWLGSVAKESPAEWDSLAVRLRFTAAALKLPLSEYQDLECGDIVLIDADPRRKGGIKISTNGDSRAYCMASWEGQGLVLEERMAMEGKQEATGQSAGRDSLADLDMDMQFELGQRSITLGELREISQGYVFLLPDNPEGRVDIRVNGRIIGQGRLVKVSGHAGVRVELLRKDNDGAEIIQPYEELLQEPDREETSNDFTGPANGPESAAESNN